MAEKQGRSDLTPALEAADELVKKERQNPVVFLRIGMVIPVLILQVLVPFETVELVLGCMRCVMDVVGRGRQDNDLSEQDASVVERHQPEKQSYHNQKDDCSEAKRLPTDWLEFFRSRVFWIVTSVVELVSFPVRACPAAVHEVMRKENDPFESEKP